MRGTQQISFHLVLFVYYSENVKLGRNRAWEVFSLSMDMEKEISAI